MTGFPGWLTQALLDDFSKNPAASPKIRALVHPSFLAIARDIQSKNSLILSVDPFDLGLPDPNPNKLVERLTGADVVLHTAAVIHVRRTSDWYRINFEGTLRLAKAAQAAGVRRFVFISSNAAGGRCESPSEVLTESMPPRPLSHYGRSKWMAEQALMEMHQPGTFECVILRPSMFYGPPVPDRHVDVYRRIITGGMPMVGTGDYRRSITYIDNLIQATRLAIDHPAAAGETFYVVDEPVYTTRSITEAMAAALGVPLRVLRLPAIAGPAAYCADRALAWAGLYWQNLHLLGESTWHVALSCAKLKERLGYAPSVELEEGMARAVKWCRGAGKL